MSWIIIDYQCGTCGIVEESTERRSECPSERPCTAPDCQGTQARCLSAISFKTKYGTVQTGTSDERPPWALDTRPLAEGTGYGTWRKSQKKKRLEARRAAIRQAVS